MTSLLDLLSQQQSFFKTRQALVILGLQNDFCLPSGKLPVNFQSGFIQNIRSLIPEFRANGDIIWVRSEYTQNRPVNGSDDCCTVILDGDLAERQDESDVSLDIDLEVVHDEQAAPSNVQVQTSELSDRSTNVITTPGRDTTETQSSVDEELFLTQTPDKPACCIPGSSGAEYSSEIFGHIDHSKDTQLVKTHYSAFTSTSLLLTLRAKLITEVYIVGCFSNLSAYATAMDAARHGITINLVEDCLGYRIQERHQKAMQQMVDHMGAFVTTSKSVMSRLRGEEEEAEENDQSQTPEDGGGVPLPAEDNGRDPSLIRSTSLAAESIQHLSTSPLSTTGADHVTHSTATERGDSSSTEPAKPAESTIGPDSVYSEPIAMSSSLAETQQLAKRPVDEIEISASMPGSDVIKYLERKRHASRSKPDSSETMTHGKDTQDSDRESSTSSLGHEDFPYGKKRRSVDVDETMRTEMVETYTPRSSDDNGGHESFQAGPGSYKKAKYNHRVASNPTLGPGDQIGSGDSSIIHDLLPPQSGRSLFRRLLNEVHWQRMHHAAGEVPRLVCCQGDIDPTDGSMPVYRHPSDQSLPLLHWSPSVARVKREAERKVGHGLNHVLIQLYRCGTDHISEHTDKTLDIVHGSNIVNVSFGAQRTMRVRTKRKRVSVPSINADDQHPDGIAQSRTLPLRPRTDHKEESDPQQRQIQRIPMPHNSIFILGPRTNSMYLHGIQPDKRMSSERSKSELAYGGYRISLTFRQIGTFISHDSKQIWGQGATAKTREDKTRTLNGQQQESQDLINAFGIENQSTDFDWQGTYGAGSDVLHLRSALPDKERPIVFLSDDEKEVESIRIWTRDLGVDVEEVNAPVADLAPGSGEPVFDENGEPLQPAQTTTRLCLRDNDPIHTQIEGLEAVLLYLRDRDRNQRAGAHDTGAQAAKELELLTGPLLAHLRILTEDLTNGIGDLDISLLQVLEDQLVLMRLVHAISMLSEEEGEGDGRRKVWLAGPGFGIADCAFYPLVRRIRDALDVGSESGLTSVDEWLMAVNTYTAGVA